MARQIIFDILSWYEPGINDPEGRTEWEEKTLSQSSDIDWCGCALKDENGLTRIESPLFTRNIRPVIPVPCHMMPALNDYLTRERLKGATYEDVVTMAYHWMAEHWEDEEELRRKALLYDAWEKVHRMHAIYDFDSTQSADDLLQDLQEILQLKHS